jgi:small subunit ribosomal protein S1
MGSRSKSRSSRRERPRAAHATHDPAPPLEPEFRGHETLQIREGHVVGLDGPDVFVELGPRFQGVIGVDRFEEPPQVGQIFAFTLRGQEETLWRLELAETVPLAAWERMELGSLVEARVLGRTPGGLSLRIGRLHGFMPRSECGVGRRGDPSRLIGSSVLCEVIEVDPSRQRCLLSRKKVLRAERDAVEALPRPGLVLPARVTSFVNFGAKVALPGGRSGLLHISNIAYEHIEHPGERLEIGESLDVVVLSVKRGGKRISVGLKQLCANPWVGLEKRLRPHALFQGVVVRVAPYGIFVEVAKGVVGLAHRSELPLAPDVPVAAEFSTGQEVAVRFLEIDVERERLALSNLGREGRALRADSLADAEDLDAVQLSPQLQNTVLGRQLAAALGGATAGKRAPKRNVG